MHNQLVFISFEISMLQDPSKDPQLSFADFAAAADLDPDNADIYHHRGQVQILAWIIQLFE